MWKLHRQGWSGRAIAHHLGLGRTTVFRHLRTEVFPERKGRSDGGRSLLDPWRHVVLKRWNAGRCRTQAPPARPRPVLATAPQRVLMPRTAAWLVLRRAPKHSVADRALLDELRRHAPELDEAVALAKTFAGLVRDQAPERLDPWLQRAEGSTVQQLRGFAKRLWADYDAVRVAMVLDYHQQKTPSCGRPGCSDAVMDASFLTLR